MFTNFFNNNKGKILGSVIPGAFVAGSVYDMYRNRRNRRKNKALPTSTVWQGPLQPPKATYTSDIAKNRVNQAQTALNNYKARTNTPTTEFDPLANIGALEARDKRRDDEDEDEGPSLVDKYLREVQRIQSGNFEYSATEKKSIDNLHRAGRDAELRQSRVNENYMGGTLQGELRSGRSRYAQEIADDAMINAMQTGVDAINEIDLETQRLVGELEQSIKEERLRQVAENYGLLQEQDRQRIDVSQNLQENLLEFQELQANILNNSRTGLMKEYEFAVANGFNGSIIDFERAMARAGRASKFAPVRNSTPSYFQGSQTSGGSNSSGYTIVN